MQAGDPTLGARLQGGDRFGREAETHHLVEEGGRFVGRKAQIGGAQLGQLAPRPQAGQRQRRVSAAGNGQMQLARQMVEQKGQGGMDRLDFNQVVIVEHQADIL